MIDARNYKTSPSDVAYFEKRVIHWQRQLGLLDWLIEVYARDIEENSGEAEMWHNAHAAHIRINSRFIYRPTRSFIDRLALHEVAHLLLCDLKRLIHIRKVNPEWIDTAEHSIIRRLENSLR